jgi:hypothetical protein
MARKKKEVKEEIPWTRFIYNPKEIQNSVLDDIIKDMLEWSTKEDSFRITQFMADRFISHGSWHGWRTRYAPLAEAIDIVLQRLANRREIGALTGKLNAMVVMRTLAMYDPMYKIHYKWEKEQQQNVLSNETRIVVLEKFPEAKKKEINNGERDPI